MMENVHIEELKKEFINIFTLWEFTTANTKGRIKKDITYYCSENGGFRNDYIGGNPEPVWRGLTGIGYSIQDNLLVIGVGRCRNETKCYKYVKNNKFLRRFVKKYAPPLISEKEFLDMCKDNGLHGEIIPHNDSNRPNEVETDYYVIKGKYTEFCRAGWRSQYLHERDSLFTKGREYLRALLPDIMRAYKSNMSRWVAGSIPYKIKNEKDWDSVRFNEGGMLFPVFEECDPIGCSFSEGGYETLTNDELAVLMVAVSCHLNNICPEKINFDLIYWDMKVYAPFCISEREVDVDTLAYKIKANQKFGLVYGQPSPLKEHLNISAPRKGLFD